MLSEEEDEQGKALAEFFGKRFYRQNHVQQRNIYAISSPKKLGRSVPDFAQVRKILLPANFFGLLLQHLAVADDLVHRRAKTGPMARPRLRSRTDTVRQRPVI